MSRLATSDTRAGTVGRSAANRAVHRWRLHTLLALMHLIRAQIFRAAAS
jgi:hypothetical protein